MRSAGMGWPNGAVTGGNSRILSLPSPDLLMLNSEHWHFDEAVRAGKRVLWRGVAAQNALPAKVGYSASRYAASALRHVNEISEPVRAFVGWNELDLNGERGDSFDDFGDLDGRYAVLGAFLTRLMPLFRQALPANCDLHFGAWTPDHDATAYIPYWGSAALACNVIDFHAYDSLDNIRRQYDEYRSLFPSTRLALTEWHCKGDLEEERRTLQWLADVMAEDPLFDAAYFFIWRWWNTPGWWSDSYDVEHNPSRLFLFMSPPVAIVPAPPVEPEPVPEPEPPAPDPDPPQPAPGVPEPWLHWSPARIAEATGCPRPHIVEHWPRIVAQLEACGINDRDVQAAMIGTVAIESASTFAPVREAFWLSEEWRRANLRYYPWYGRGYIQLTWESNYAAYGQKVNELWGAGGAIDLIARPDDALDPDVSAAVSALYFRDHGREDGEGIPEAARRGDWREVRRLVQGADAGLDRLTEIVSALLGTAPPDVTERMYGVDVPDSVIFQQNTWTCAVRATYAALWALAEQGMAEPVTYGDGGPRDVYDWLVPRWDAPNIGLLDHTGAGLAEALRSRGYAASHYYPISLAAVLEVAGTQPVLLGGDNWNHWVYVRGRTNDGGLILENPSPGHAGINDYLRDSFDKLGPMAVVLVAPAPAPYPTDPLDVLADRLELARAGLDDGVARPTGSMLKAELHANLEQAWKNIDAAYAEIGLIGDEMRRVGKEAL